MYPLFSKMRPNTGAASASIRRAGGLADHSSTSLLSGWGGRRQSRPVEGCLLYDRTIGHM